MKIDSAHGGYLREDLIRDQIKTHTIQQLDENGILAVGLDAGELAETLHLDRSNISKDLNHLNREGKLTKFQGRPTLYLDRESIIQKFPDRFIPSVIAKSEKLSDYTQHSSSDATKRKPERGAFDNVLGKNGSMSSAIHMAKVAVQYPPHGLHTLLIGATDAVKTQFAREIYRYALEQGIFEATAPFVEFNCQDYVFSNQSLISQLFGYVKGAVPGGEKGKRGILESTAGGILYINEFQKLPTKAQNMLVDVIERGTYSRLGEHSITHSADFMMIFSMDAETEPTELNRLTSLIPNTIQLPDLTQINASEKLEYLFTALFEEANKTKKTISIGKDMVHYLLSLSYQGSIGQFQTEIKKICAITYADHHPAQNNIAIGFEHVTPSKRIRELISPQEQVELSQMLGYEKQDVFVFVPGGKLPIPIGPTEESPTAVTEEAEDFEAILSTESIDTSLEYHEEYVSRYVEKLARLDKQITRLQSGRLINPLIEQSVRRILIKEQRYNRFMERKQLYYGLLLHLTKVIKVAKNHRQADDTDQNIGFSPDGEPCQSDIQRAKAIVDALNAVFSISIRSQELKYVALYLNLSIRWLAENAIGLILICHGSQTAESMAQYVNQLFGEKRVEWLNFDESESLESFQKKVAGTIERIDQGLGVLILSDIEPLASIHLQMKHLIKNNVEGVSDISMSKLIDIAQFSMNSNSNMQTVLDHIRRLQSKQTESEPGSNKYSQLINRVIHDMLTTSLTFIDPVKVAYALLNSLEEILKEIDLPYLDEIAIKYIFHCAVMFERVIKKEPFSYNRLKTFINKNNALVTMIDKHLSKTAEIFGVTIPTSELAYIADIFLPYMNKRIK